MESSIKELYYYYLEATEYYNQMIASLSHGNKQKMQIIASILHEPDLLILDEPISGLDAKSVRVVKEILDMHIEKGGAVLFSTHIMEVAEDLCDRIAIINRGKLVGIGTIDELRQQANKLGASLEDVFLRLTEQDSSVNDIVKKLYLGLNIIIFKNPHRFFQNQGTCLHYIPPGCDVKGQSRILLDQHYGHTLSINIFYCFKDYFNE